MDHTQVNLIQLKTFELELDSAEYIQYTDLRIVALCWAPIYHLQGNVMSATATSPNNFYELPRSTRFGQFQKL